MLNTPCQTARGSCPWFYVLDQNTINAEHCHELGQSGWPRTWHQGHSPCDRNWCSRWTRGFAEDAHMMV